MAYRIDVLTFENPLPIRFHYIYWPPTTDAFSFADAKHSVIYLDDPDGAFGETDIADGAGQKLLVDLDLSGEVLKAGTVLALRRFSATRMKLRGEDVYYRAIVPHVATDKALNPTLVGENKTIFIITTKDNPIPFDPQQMYQRSSRDNSTSLEVAETAIPPGYLSPPCFVTGTLIDTDDGSRPVEALREGDLILTKDSGFRRLSWVAFRHLTPRHLDISPNLRPILIRAGALGPGMPQQNLLVSPQHRMLVTSRIARRLIGAEEALVPAKHLCGLPGIEVMDPANGVGYHHLLFDRHEIVRSNGCWTELLYTGPMALKSLGAAARRELRALLPGLIGAGQPLPPPARPFMSGKQIRELTRQHIMNDLPLAV